MLVIYLALTFAVSWTLWWASGATTGGATNGLFLIGVFAPGIVALLFTSMRQGSGGVTGLLRRLVDWDVPWRWYLFAIGYMAAIKIVVAVVYRIAFSTWPAFGREPWWLLVAATLTSTIVGGQAGEELGWRGYLLPRLSVRLGPGRASIVLGVVWALWHLPLFFAPAADTFHQSFGLYLLQLTALSVAMTYLYANTKGSLLPVMLMHAAVNNTKDLVPSADAVPAGVWSVGHSVVGWLTVLTMWAVAMYLLVKMPSMRTTPARGGTSESGVQAFS